MRVLMLSWDFPPRTTGGTAAHVDGLTKALATAGHDIVVLTIAERITDVAVEATPPTAAGGMVRVLRTAVDLPWLPPVDTVARTASANHAFTKLGAQLATLLDTDGADGSWRPDIVHGHDWRTGWAADTLSTLFGVPFVLTMHGTERMRHGGQLPLGDPTDINSIEWWLAFQADRLIAPTQFMVEQLITGFELDADHVARIPNGVDPTYWQPPADHAVEREPLVLSWGNVQFEKGFQVLARSMHLLRGRVPNVRGVIAGRGSYLPDLQSQIDVEGVSDIVELPGYVPDGALRSLAHRAGLVVIPSLYEPFGIVALEALAAGAPLIVARTGGLAELLVDTDAGITFEPGNPEDLARCIAEVLTDPDRAAGLMSHGRALVEKTYAWDAIAAATATVYEGLLTSTHRRD
ncbi:MAG: glycosyltransferase family 4 protein [Ilumatobacteraceae bacterium]